MSSDKIADLRELGFADPVKMVTSFPEIAGIAIDNVRRKIANLRELGFGDPVKMVTSCPTILSYSTETIRGKIEDLRDLGFADPVKMITSLPTILGYAVDGIRTKITDLRDFGSADPVTMITSSPAILGYARERLLLCGRIVAKLDDGGFDAMFARLIKQPRAVIDAVALAQPRTWSDVRAVIVVMKRRAATTAKG
jgi:hypothetical protein